MVLIYLSWGGKKLSSHPFLKPKLLVKRIKRATHTYLSAFSKSNIAKANVNLIKSKYKIFSRGPFIWNTFLGASEKNIEFFSNFKSKVKAKLLCHNDIISVDAKTLSCCSLDSWKLLVQKSKRGLDDQVKPAVSYTRPHIYIIDLYYSLLEK